MAQKQLSIEDLLMIIGQKEVENIVLKQEIAKLTQRVKELEYKTLPDEDQAKVD